MLKTDATWDQALLELDGEPYEDGIVLARAEPQMGDKLVIGGYGGLGADVVPKVEHLRILKSQVVGHNMAMGENEYGWLKASTVPRSGDSGGAVLNAEGEFVGNLWGGNTETMAVTCWRTRRFLLPWNARLEAVRLRQWGQR